MRKLLAAALLALLSVTAAVADQINFHFTFDGPNSVTATKAGGVVSGGASLTEIDDSTTGVIVPTMGTYVHGNTGPAKTFFAVAGTLVAVFTPGATGSVLLEDSMGNPLLTGTMNDNATLIGDTMGGNGSLNGKFSPTFVSPTVFTALGLSGVTFAPTGGVALSFGGGAFDGTTFTAEIGGGSVTINTIPTTAVPEPTSLVLMGGSLIAVGGFFRKSRFGKRS